MKILLVGPTEAGKTTYVLGAYGAMQRGMGGVRVRAKSMGEHWRLRWLGMRMWWGTFPAPSDRRVVHAFRLVKGWSTLLEFTLHDYRGGVLDDPSGEPQTAELLRDLREADGVLVFCDCTYGGDDELARDRAGTLAEVVFRVMEEKRGRLAVVIVFTKSDLAPGFDPDAPGPYAPLARAVRVSGGGQAAVVPVACGPAGRNERAPLAFCLHVWAARAAAQAGARAWSEASDAADLRRRVWFWNTFVSGLFGQPDNRELARLADKRAAAARRQEGRLERVGASLLRASATGPG